MFMKRTREITLSIIGAITALFGIVIFGAFKKVFLMEDLVNDIVLEFNEDMAGSEIETLDGASFVAGISIFFNIMVIIFITALILAIIAAILFKNNNKPKMASIILIIAAVVVTVATLGFGLITGILLIIPGIMGLVRKPVVEIPTDDMDGFYSDDNADEDSDNPYRT